jgi:hypothetical protein
MRLAQRAAARMWPSAWRNFLTRFAKRDTPIYRMMKQLYVSLVR